MLIFYSTVCNANNLNDKLNFIIYLIEGENFNQKEKIYIDSFFNSKPDSDKFILVAIVNHNSKPTIVHFNDDKKLSVSKGFLTDSIYKYALEYSMKNDFNDVEALQSDLLHEMKDIFQLYDFTNFGYDVDFCNIINVSSFNQLLNKNSKILQLINQFKLLSLIESGKLTMKYYLRQNKETSNIHKNDLLRELHFHNQNNKYEINFK